MRGMEDIKGSNDERVGAWFSSGIAKIIYVVVELRKRITISIHYNKPLNP